MVVVVLVLVLVLVVVVVVVVVVCSRTGTAGRHSLQQNPRARVASARCYWKGLLHPRGRQRAAIGKGYSNPGADRH